ncbi:MAG: VPLPA-CTERM sorting domain-containing protein, partial [Halothiobacillaceae bacterium]
SSAGDGTVSFLQAPTGGGDLWSVSNPHGYSDIIVVIKQANAFGAFLLDASAALSGTWLTNGPGQSVGGLSHASVYYTGSPSPVPLPATGILVLGAMGALAAVKGRRKSA